MAVKINSRTSKPVGDDPQGISAVGAGLFGLWKDSNRNAANSASDVVDFFASRAPGSTRVGDYIFGKPESSTSARRTPGYGTSQHQAEGRAAQDAVYANRAEPKPMTFADYLQLANDVAAGDGTDYGALVELLKGNAAGADSKLEAMYRQLRNSIDADATGINQTYDQAGAQLAQNGQQAAAQVNAGYNAARDAQTRQFAALGIGDAAGVLAANGGHAANDQAVANSNIAQDQLANQNQNTQNKSSALTYNTNIGNAAGLEGNVQRARLQQDLANKLADLQTAQGESQAGQQTSRYQMALQMAQNPAIFDPSYSGDPKTALENQLLAQQVLTQQLKNQGLAANSSGQVGANLSQYQTLAQAFGIDPSDQEAFLNFIKLVNETQ